MRGAFVDSTLQQQETSYKLTKEEWNTIEDRRFEYEKTNKKNTLKD